MENGKKMSYHQITGILRSEIENRKFAENGRFSTEREIMERFQVSRMTARQVINDLIAEGLLYRIKGRGAFIHKKIIQRSAYIHSFSELMRERGKEPSSSLLSLKKVVPPEIARLNLELEEGEYCYFIQRIRYADLEPIAFENIYAPVELVPGVEAFDLEHDSFYRILAEEYGQEFSYDKEMISAVTVDGEPARILYGKESSIALQIIDILYDVNQKPLEYTESWYHAEKYSYMSISVKRGNRE